MPKLNEILGEAYSQIPEDIRKKYKDIDLVDSSNYVEKKEIESVNNSIKEYKKQLKDRDKQLEDLQGKVKDNEELTKEIESLKKDNEKVTKEYENKLNKLTFEAKLERKLEEFKPKNLGIFKKALDIEKISLDGENFIGLEDQIKSLKESDPYLFTEEIQGGTGNLGGGQSSLGTDNKELSLGARLAKERADASKATEAQNKFFS